MMQPTSQYPVEHPTTLAAYLDGELTSDQAAAIEQHIADCPACASEVASLLSLKRSLAPARNHFAPSADFRQKMQRQLATKKPRLNFFRFIPAAVALAAMLLVALVYTQHSRRADTFAEVADLHINSLASTTPYDVVSTDRHTVKPWFQGRIPFSFNVPELAGTNFTLLGGRLVYLHQQPGAQLIVGVRQHKLSVLIFQNAAAPTDAFATAGVSTRNSFSVETWSSQNLRFYIIGDTDPADIDKLSQLLKQSNQ